MAKEVCFDFPDGSICVERDTGTASIHSRNPFLNLPFRGEWRPIPDLLVKRTRGCASQELKVLNILEHWVFKHNWQPVQFSSPKVQEEYLFLYDGPQSIRRKFAGK